MSSSDGSFLRGARKGQCFKKQHPADTITRDCMCGTARQMLDGFSRGERRFFLSKGQFSMVDVAVALTAITGPVELQCAVWTGTKASIEQIDRLVSSGRVTDTRWVLCDSQRDLNEDRMRRIVELFGLDSVRAVRCHAKMMTVRGDGWHVVVQSSANMTKNRSVEQYDVTDSERLYGHVDRFFDEVWKLTDPLDVDRDGEQVEAVHQSLCLGHHVRQADPLDAAPVGVADGL